MDNKNVYEKSLDFHKKYNGKLETNSKVRLDSKEILSIAYSPGVAEISRVIASNPKMAKELTLKGNTIAIVSDGTAILGLGDLGPMSAIPVMEGKAAIFKEFGGINAFPICLDTKDTEEIIKAVKQIAPVFGGVNLEDISAPRCFEIEERLRKELSIPVMHDDQWGAATATLAGLINSLKLVNKNKEDIKVVLSGIGAAGVASARLLLNYGIKNIIFCDSKGVISEDRLDLTKEKIELLEASNIKPKDGDLKSALIDADIFIGLSKAGLVTKEMILSMAKDPIIFGLANPIPEIMPEEAKEAGAFIVATGRSDYPNQINNSLVFPGAFRGMLEADIPQFKIEMFSAIAVALADSVKDLSKDKIIPTMWDEGIVELVSSTIKKFK
jgi:malate dehydrogenase (oxaloacetate-decarboxylating)